MNNQFFHFNRGDRMVLLLLLLLLTSGIFLFLFSPQSKADRLPSSLALAKGDTLTIQKDLPSTEREQPKTQNRDTLETNDHYVGPPQTLSYTPKKRIPKGIVLDLNRVDSATLTQVPSIGPTFARRIINYRQRLGGYYTVLQLQEVYGMTQERYEEIKPYFSIASLPKPILWDTVSYNAIPRHPYLNYLQRSALERILYREGRIESWQQLQNLSEFTLEDSIRLSHYFSF